MSTVAPPRPAARPGGSTRLRVEQDRRFRRSLVALLLTLVLPGSAQLALGRGRHRRVGQVALAVWAALLLLALVLVAVGGRSALLGAAVNPTVLALVRVGALLLALAWAALLLDAWRLGHPPALRREHRLAMTATAVGLVAVVVAPLVVVSHYAAAQGHLVGKVFGGGTVAAATDGRINVLLLGGDAGKDRMGLRTDSMNLVSVDVATGRTMIVGLPRNLQHARFAAGTPLARAFPVGFQPPPVSTPTATATASSASRAPDTSDYLLNAVYGYGTAHPALLPGAADPGAEAIKEAVAGSLGVTVHYYVLVNLNGFKKVIDALGGITLRVEEQIPYGLRGGVLQPGVRRLKGSEALWYARSRTGSSDYVRMHRQRCVLGALLREVQPAHVLRRFGALADSAEGVLSTDVPQGALPELVALGVKARGLPVRSLQLSPPLVMPAHPDFAVISRTVHAALRPATTSGTTAAAAAARQPAAAATSKAPAGSALGDVRGVGGASDIGATCAYS